MHLSELKALHVSALIEMANGLEIENANRLRKQELMFAILKKRAKTGDTDFRRRRARSAAGRLRLPALARHLYLASTDDIYISPVANPPLQPAYRRHDRRRSAHAERRRALFRAGQGGQGQRRTAGGLETQDPVRKPDAAASEQAAAARTRNARRRKHHRPHHRHDRADRQGPARPAGRFAEVRQDR